MDQFVERALHILQHHWGDAYKITWDCGFHAERRDGGGTLSAGTPEGLRTLILADYTSEPVVRHESSSL